MTRLVYAGTPGNSQKIRMTLHDSLSQFLCLGMGARCGPSACQKCPFDRAAAREGKRDPALSRFRIRGAR